MSLLYLLTTCFPYIPVPASLSYTYKNVRTLHYFYRRLLQNSVFALSIKELHEQSWVRPLLPSTIYCISLPKQPSWHPLSTLAAILHSRWLDKDLEKFSWQVETQSQTLWDPSQPVLPTSHPPNLLCLLFRAYALPSGGWTGGRGRVCGGSLVVAWNSTPKNQSQVRQGCERSENW